MGTGILNDFQITRGPKGAFAAQTDIPDVWARTANADCLVQFPAPPSFAADMPPHCRAEGPPQQHHIGRAGLAGCGLVAKSRSKTTTSSRIKERDRIKRKGIKQTGIKRARVSKKPMPRMPRSRWYAVTALRWCACTIDPKGTIRIKLKWHDDRYSYIASRASGPWN